jgi:2-amino-4-hydroxy-6-hydroxymethyldihydropteridine diphosphokinase
VTRVYIGAGSNIEPRRHLASALGHLSEAFGSLVISPVYRSAAAGFIGDPFLNLVIGIDSELSITELKDVLRSIERANGYDGLGPKFSSRTLDLDLLLYGDFQGSVAGIRVPRNDVLNCSYVLWPLADIAPAERHPVTGESYETLREAFTGNRELERIPFIWRGRDLSA